MSQRIRQDDIDRVREATDIVAIAEESLTVNRRRNIAWALCPFHQEKTPSFKLDSSTGLYYCFGCGQAGNVFQFLERTEGLTFTEAVEKLAQRAGIQLQYEGKKGGGRDKRGRLVEAIEAAVTFYEGVLRESPEGENARDYLKSRGFGNEELSKFRLGFSPGAWDGLSRHLHKSGFAESEIVAAGLAYRNDRGRLTDQFRERITFPIFDAAGKPVAFGARAMGDAKPKYKNSSTGALYDKSRILYGLNWARGEIVSKNSVVVVEGYTDVIALDQAGIKNAVATCGTAMGDGHFEALRRFAPASGASRLKVLLAFDADAAGQAASRRGFELQHAFGFDVRVVSLPAGLDPADAARNDPASVRSAIDHAEPLMRFKIRTELERFDLELPEYRVDALRGAAATVALHPDRLVRHEYAQEVAYITGIDVDEVRGEIERAVASAGQEPAGSRSSGRTVRGESQIEERRRGDSRAEASRPGKSAPAPEISGDEFEDVPEEIMGSQADAIRRLDDLDALVLRILMTGSDESRAKIAALGSGVMRGKGARRVFELLAGEQRPDIGTLIGEMDEADPARAVVGHVAIDASASDAEPEVFEARVITDAERRLLKSELDTLAELVRSAPGGNESRDATRRFNDLQARLKALR